MKRWRTVVASKTEVEFNEAWVAFKNNADNPPAAITYIETQWLPEKEKFIKAWTSQYRHFNHVVTSRAEGAHARVKSYIEVSTGNLLTTYEKILQAHKAEYMALNTAMSQDKLRREHKMNRKLYDELRGKVSSFALYRILEQEEQVRYSKAEGGRPLGSCTGAFEKIMGLPCKHTIAAYLLVNKNIPISDIDHQWYLIYPAPALPVQ